MATLSEFKNYIGDISLEYGGLFINLGDFKHGYADCLRVIDLDGAAGVDQTVLVERITAYFDDGKKVKRALESCSWEGFKEASVDAKKGHIIESCVWYGLYDSVSDMSGPHTWIIVEHGSYATQEELESWQGEIVRLDEYDDVFNYLYNEGFLSEFE